MRSVQSLVHARTRVEQRYALMPLEGFPFSRLPSFPDAQVRVLASPALGAQFVQYLIDLPAKKRGNFAAEDGVETFFYVLAGDGSFSDGGQTKMSIKAGHFGLTPPGHSTHLIAGDGPLSVLILRKCYEAAPGVELYKGIYLHENDVEKQVWADNPHSLLQTLIPDELPFDISMNIFTFDPGFGLPIIETHVMEHGLYFLQGKGVYHLAGDWMEVEKDDFIWMGPYCPQSFYATGPTASRYLYYKNVNRESPL
jgi:(S)-ureidoglycine aminohydrolase